MGWQSETALERFGNSIVGFFMGPVLVICGCVLLFWNEGRYVYTLTSIDDARSSCLTLPCGTTWSEIADGSAGAVDGDLVYFGGCNVTQLANLTDSVFPGAVASVGASIMAHELQVYLVDQVCVSKQGRGGGQVKTCRYTTLRWFPCNHYPMSQWDMKDPEANHYKAINTPFFDKCSVLAQNATSPVYCTATAYSAECAGNSIQVGGTVAVSRDAIDRLSIEKPSSAGLVTDVPLVDVANLTANNAPNATFVKDVYNTTLPSTYCYPNCTSQLGNMKVQFPVHKFNQVSIAGTLRTYGGTFEPGRIAVLQTTPSHGGTQMTYASLGNASKDSLFDQALEENVAISWALRAVGFVIIWLGAIMFFLPAAKFLAVCSTCLGDIVEEIICCVTCPFAVMLTLVFIAIGWVAYRPIVAAPMLAVAALALGFMAARAFKRSRSTGGYTPIQ